MREEENRVYFSKKDITFYGDTEKEKKLNEKLFDASLLIAQKDDEIKEKDKEIEKLRKITKQDECDYYVEGLEGLVKEKNREIERLNNIINEFDEWLKEKKEQMEEFELYKRKETGAFWFSTMGNIETFIKKIKELKGSDKK